MRSVVGFAAWLIPAHAGKTPPRFSSWNPVPAHPRSRGENAIAAGQTSAAYGSSPLTRGKHLANERSSGGVRLIPAHAGKTVRGGEVAARGPAHPRSRGENRRRIRGGTRSRGSSPLTRGKRLSRSTRQIVRWLIPAHAGKTPRNYPHYEMSRAHPRSRGENAMWIGGGQNFGGSSPLTRGKPV